MAELTINGRSRPVKADPGASLLSVVREEWRLTGTKYGCGEGSCGACTLLVDGRPVRSCGMTVGDASGHSITTIEGLARGKSLHPVQAAFAEVGAMQCGFCTPGMVMSTVALLDGRPDPSDAEIIEALSANLCRCCGYPRIVEAVHRAAAIQLDPAVVAAPPRSEPAPLNLPTRQAGVPWDLTPARKRGYFSELPEGVVVVLEGQAGEWAATGGAWLHVGANGIATAFTGKVDVGQDSRTALALIVAEELRLPLERVRMVMGDTDFCPYDMGTFGSQSMPGAGEDLRALGASTRAILEALARRHRLPAQWPAYRKMLQGMRQLELIKKPAAPTPPENWSIAGTPTVRAGAKAIVTGAQLYPTDLHRPRMLHGKVLRPPALGAKLIAVDLSAAKAIRGVVVAHEGDFVGVAATTPATARRALEAVDAKWEASLQPGERSLVEDIRSSPVEVEGWFGAHRSSHGDVERALQSAPVRLAQTYTTAYIAHAPLEPRAVVAEWTAKRLTVWASTQTPFMVRRQLAENLGVDESSIRVVVPLTGGGFGGKHAAGAALEAARLARAAGRPVSLAWTRDEEFRWGYFRPAAVIDVSSGAERDGTLTAWRFTNYNAGRASIEPPYAIPNRRLEFQPTESPLPGGAYRGIAAVANSFARESHIDEMARQVDRDPLEFRLAHVDDERLGAVLRIAADRAGWAGRPRGAGRGMGIAGAVEKGGRVASCIEVEVESSGQVRILKVVTAYECGAIVNPKTVRSQVEGGIVMALGGAMFEVVHFDDGRILNGAFSSYRVPRFRDVPPLEVVLVDRRDIPSAGAGETPLLAVAPALANAIHEATGVRLRSLPLVPDGTVPRAPSVTASRSPA